MELPIRVRGRMGWSRFLFFIVLDTVLALLMAFGPAVGLWYYLAPGNFGERLISVIFCGSAVVVLGFVAVFFWCFFISWATDY